MADTNPQETPPPAVPAPSPKKTKAPLCRSSIRITGNEQPLPKGFVTAIQAIESVIGTPIVMYLQSDRDSGPLTMVSDEVFAGFSTAKLPDKKVTLLIHSLGGYADSAYQTVNVLRHKCGGFDALVPDQAKSAATLLAMGGERLLMHPLAHLGPIDPQVFDVDSHQRKSALETVQAVERMRSESLETLSLTMVTMLGGTQLPSTTLLPFAIEFATGFMRPLLEKVDVNMYMRMSRAMKVGEEYASRIMEPVYGRERARQVASAFSQKYPEHGFVILGKEAEEQGLNVEIVTDGELLKNLANLSKYVGNITAYGMLEEI